MSAAEESVTHETVKTLYIAGKGRSGSTLLGSLLGQIPGFFNAGELHHLWDWAITGNYKCGCGEPFESCATWAAILDEADRLLDGSGIPPLREAHMDRMAATIARWPNVLRLLRAKPGPHPRWPDLDRYTTAVSAVYRAIAHVTGCKVIVDSSKLPIEPVAMGLVPGVDLRVVHLVRDPRAITYAYRRKRVWTDRENNQPLPRYHASSSALSWLARTLVVEQIANRQPFDTVLYTDLTADPAGVLRRLADLAGEPAGDLDFLAPGEATIKVTHTVGGNPVRMVTGTVPIKPDIEWRDNIKARDRIVTDIVAFPRLRRYTADKAAVTSGSTTKS